jgi:hypothetical protein
LFEVVAELLLKPAGGLISAAFPIAHHNGADANTICHIRLKKVQFQPVAPDLAGQSVLWEQGPLA